MVQFSQSSGYTIYLHSLVWNGGSILVGCLDAVSTIHNSTRQNIVEAIVHEYSPRIQELDYQDRLSIVWDSPYHAKIYDTDRETPEPIMAISLESTTIYHLRK